MSSFDKKFDHLKIPLVDIQTATNGFAEENVIGGGGFGIVYKGRLSRSGKMIDVAARRWNDKYGQGSKQFQMEIMMLSILKHPNLVSIVGFCDEDGEMIVVNEFETKGSLDQLLGDPVTLTWTQRLQICLDVARALSYIHYDKDRSFCVIHRNVKSSKFLLGENWEAKLSGFGYSIMQPIARRHGFVLDPPCGTPMYVDPAYVKSGGVTQKSDVYSFGVVLFEVLSGRKAYNKGAMLVELAKSHYENGTLYDIVHPGLQNQIDSHALKVYSEAAYFCLNEQRSQRPSVDRVILALEQTLKIQQIQLANVNSEHQTLAAKDTSTGYLKGEELEHLKIGLDAIDSAKKTLIGKGTYGSVYKAELDSTVIPLYKAEQPKRNITVAIKEIIYREDEEGEQGFFAEIKILSRCKHPNVVSLLGFCYEHPRMILVYEHISNGSLEDYLGSEAKMNNLTWMHRLKICIDIARGLDYMHSPMDNKPKIIHRDVKSANILLGEKWEGKIADFGLSIFHPLNHPKSTINATKIAGTDTYLDPEYESTGKLKKESDVYSFGVVMFEILTGRFAYEWVTTDNERGLAPIVRQLFKTQGTLEEIVDPKLKEESDGKGYILSKGLNKDSLHKFSKIGDQCLSEKQDQRPTMDVVIKELEEALKCLETHRDNLHISFEDLRLATQDFNDQIGVGGFGSVYRGEILRANGPTPIAVKRHNAMRGQGDNEFRTELEILLEYKHENIIDLIGYCHENNEKIIVYEYASNGSLNKHLENASLSWAKRLKIVIDIASGLDFLHGGDYPVIHKDVKSGNILLNRDWKAKITDFGLSMIAPLNSEIDFVVDLAAGTPGYIDPQYRKSGFLTRESDIYSLGVVLFEMMCGRLVYIKDHQGAWTNDFIPLVKRHYEKGKIKELVFNDIKDEIVPKSWIAFTKLAFECLHDERKKRPTASNVLLQLKEALELQEDIEIWEAKLPEDYKEIIKKSKTPEKYSYSSNKDLYEMFTKGILLQKGKVFFSLSTNGERNETVSATKFLCENNKLHKRISIQNSRFQRAMKMMDISNLNIRIKIKTHFLTPNIIYGAHLVFKFCDPKTISSKPMYVNLKYQMGSETLHAYFATCGDDGWMMIELCRFIPNKKDVKFDVLLESLSRYYCGNGEIYVEGIHFRAINDENSKGVRRSVLKSNSDSEQQVSIDYDEITQLEDCEKLFSLSNTEDKKCHMLPAKMVLYDVSDVSCFNWKALAKPESRFLEVAELLSEQAFRIKCKIEAQKLSADTNYACYLVFKLSQQCQSLQCPVKVHDVVLRKNRELKFVYFRSPRSVNRHGIKRVPYHREDGLMEVIVWEFNSGYKRSDDHIRMSLKLRCYEGTMSGLVIYGIEFRPI